MVRRTICVLFGLALLPVASVSAQEAVVSLRLGDSPYEIARPARWFQGPVTGKTVVSSWVASDQYLYPLMQVTLEPLPTPGKEGVERLMASLPNNFPGYRLLEGGWMEIGGVQAYRSVATWTSIFGDLKAARLVIPWKEKAYAVTFADLATDFAGKASLYDQCLKSLGPVQEVETPEIFKVPPKKPGKP